MLIVYFHGRLMSQHTIRSLIGDKEDQTIIFGGLSAGGRGAVITIDEIKDLVHTSTTIRGLIDSAGYEVCHTLPEEYTKVTMLVGPYVKSILIFFVALWVRFCMISRCQSTRTAMWISQIK